MIFALLTSQWAETRKSGGSFRYCASDKATRAQSVYATRATRRQQTEVRARYYEAVRRGVECFGDADGSTWDTTWEDIIPPVEFAPEPLLCYRILRRH